MQTPGERQQARHGMIQQQDLQELERVSDDSSNQDYASDSATSAGDLAELESDVEKGDLYFAPRTESVGGSDEYESSIGSELVKSGDATNDYECPNGPEFEAAMDTMDDDYQCSTGSELEERMDVQDVVQKPGTESVGDSECSTGFEVEEAMDLQHKAENSNQLHTFVMYSALCFLLVTVSLLYFGVILIFQYVTFEQYSWFEFAYGNVFVCDINYMTIAVLLFWGYFHFGLHFVSLWVRFSMAAEVVYSKLFNCLTFWGGLFGSVGLTVAVTLSNLCGEGPYPVGAGIIWIGMMTVGMSIYTDRLLTSVLHPQRRHCTSPFLLVFVSLWAFFYSAPLWGGAVVDRDLSFWFQVNYVLPFVADFILGLLNVMAFRLSASYKGTLKAHVLIIHVTFQGLFWQRVIILFMADLKVICIITAIRSMTTILSRCTRISRSKAIARVLKTKLDTKHLVQFHSVGGLVDLICEIAAIISVHLSFGFIRVITLKEDSAVLNDIAYSFLIQLGIELCSQTISIVYERQHGIDIFRGFRERGKDICSLSMLEMGWVFITQVQSLWTVIALAYLD